MLKTQSGRYSRTQLLHVAIGGVANLIGIWAMLAEFISPKTLAIGNAVLLALHTIGGMYLRMLNGKGNAGEPMRKPGPPSERFVAPIGIVLVMLLTGCATTLPDFCSVEMVTIDGEEKPRPVCRPDVHEFQLDLWSDGGGEIRQVGDGIPYHWTRIKSGDPLRGLKCPR